MVEPMIASCIAAQVEVQGPRRDRNQIPASQVKAEYNITRETSMGKLEKGAARSFWKYLRATFVLSAAVTFDPAA